MRFFALSIGLVAGAAVERVDPGYPMGWGSLQSFPDRSVVTMFSPNGASRHTVLYGGPLCTLSRALVIPRENLGRFMAQNSLEPQLCSKRWLMEGRSTACRSLFTSTSRPRFPLGCFHCMPSTAIVGRVAARWMRMRTISNTTQMMTKIVLKRSRTPVGLSSDRSVLLILGMCRFLFQ